MREVGSSMFSQEKIGEADMQNKGLMSFVILAILVISFISACGLNSTNQQHITQIGRASCRERVLRNV
jgi:predicted ABC-type sugar transport system permease subunit